MSESDNDQQRCWKTPASTHDTIAVTAPDPAGVHHERSKFSKDDDSLLIELVEEYGNDWKKIASHFTNKTKNQCRDRYNHYLKFTGSNKSWTSQEDAEIISLHSQYGSRWSIIANFIDGRSATNVKNRWKVLQRAVVKPSKRSPVKKVKKVETEKKTIKKSITLDVQPIGLPEPFTDDLPQIPLTFDSIFGVIECDIDLDF